MRLAIEAPLDAETACLAEELGRLDAGRRPELDPHLAKERVHLFASRLANAERLAKPTLHLRLRLGLEQLAVGDARAAVATLRHAEDLHAQHIERPRHDYNYDLTMALALAYLRIGEQENCSAICKPLSCIAPLAESAQHAKPEGSSTAIPYLERLLAGSPHNYEARWLYNVAAMTLGEWPDVPLIEHAIPASAFESEQPAAPFANVAAATGLTSRGLAGSVCIEDFNDDGYLDIFACELLLDRSFHLYSNTGHGGFDDRSSAAGISGLTGGTNSVHADFDNDGDSDILVARGGWRSKSLVPEPLSLLRNDGTGRFVERSRSAGLDVNLNCLALTVLDYNGDGALDVFVANEAINTEPSPVLLFQGNGRGSFTDRTADAGLSQVRAKAMGSLGADIDNDGDQDLFVTRSDGPPILLRNDRGVFRDESVVSGLIRPLSAFVSACLDYDNSGRPDLLALAFDPGQAAQHCQDYLGHPASGARPRLYAAEPDGTFQDRTRSAGLWRVVPTLSVGVGDFDNDGWCDLYLGTGETDRVSPYPNRAFRNDGGAGFRDITTASMLGHLQKTSAVAFADMDNDGDQDVFALVGGYTPGETFPSALFENPGNDNAWVTLLLEGVRANRSAIGARVRVRVSRPDGSTRDIHHLVGTGGSMGSQSLQAELGLGDATGIEEVEVRWPGSGTVQTFKDIPMRQFWKLVEGQDEPIPLERKAFKLGGNDR